MKWGVSTWLQIRRQGYILLYNINVFPQLKQGPLYSTQIFDAFVIVVVVSLLYHRGMLLKPYRTYCVMYYFKYRFSITAYSDNIIKSRWNTVHWITGKLVKIWNMFSMLYCGVFSWYKVGLTYYHKETKKQSKVKTHTTNFFFFSIQ